MDNAFQIDFACHPKWFPKRVVQLPTLNKKMKLTYSLWGVSHWKVYQVLLHFRVWTLGLARLSLQPPPPTTNLPPLKVHVRSTWDNTHVHWLWVAPESPTSRYILTNIKMKACQTLLFIKKSYPSRVQRVSGSTKREDLCPRQMSKTREWVILGIITQLPTVCNGVGMQSGFEQGSPELAKSTIITQLITIGRLLECNWNSFGEGK